MKISKLKFLFLIPIFFLVLFALLMIDDPLSETSKSMLNKAEDWKGQKSEPFLYFLGMSAPIGKDPIEEGKIILNEIRSFEQKYDEVEDTELSKRVTLDLPDHKFDCPFDETQCLQQIISTSAINLDEKNLVELKSRYLIFLKMDGFRMLTKPHLSSPPLNYKNLILANKLVLLSAYKEASQGGDRTSITDLFSMMKRLNIFAKNIDDFVGKMIAYSLIDTTIDVLFLLVRTFNEKGERISPLSAEELSFEKAFVREFAASTHIHRSQKPNRLLMKTNMTINASTAVYKSVILNSKKSAIEFLALREKNDLTKTEEAWLRNPAGTTMLSIAQPDFNKYIEYGFDINAKISLFNGVLGKSLEPKNLQNITNPYYKSGHHAEIHEGKICFLSPPREDDSLCLRIVKDAEKVEEAHPHDAEPENNNLNAPKKTN